MNYNMITPLIVGH